MLKIRDLYDLNHTIAAEYLAEYEYPWQALKGIKDLILSLGPTLGGDCTEVSPTVWVHKTAKVFPSAYLGAPASSARTPRYATVPSSAAPPWWAKAAWWATPWS